ncbi:MAG: hypothetical protein K2V38_22805 [Gemmataceae bacterium]|nr:hypothetical protein [Gemmataceae bacterium]
MRHAFCLLAAVALLAFAPVPVLAQKPTRKPPADGTEFKLSPDAPKHATADVEFRDPSPGDGARWPNFCYGKPTAPGTFTFHSQKPAGAFAVACDKMAQKLGDQSRRVLGDIAPEGQPPAVAFALTRCGEVRPIDKPEKNGPKEQFPAEGTLTVGPRTVSVKGTGTWAFQYGKDGEFPESLSLTFAFDVKGADLGLKAPEVVRVTARVVAYKELPAGKK